MMLATYARRRRTTWAAATFGLVAAVAGVDSCQPTPAGSSSARPPTAWPAAPQRATATVMGLNGPVVFAVEVASTPATWASGLMGRQALAADEGMLFAFPDAARRPFWMQNTLLSLDLLFIDDDRRIVELVTDARPHDLSSLGGEKPARFVLEVAAGTAASHRLALGDRVHLAGLPPGLL